MLRVTVAAGPATDRIAPAALLGHNLELFGGVARDLDTDRLDNPKFAGAPDPQTGLARGWRAPNANFMGIQYELVAGEGILASQAQLLRSVTDRKRKGIVQPGRRVHRGETLEVSLWARAIHDPVTLRVGLGPASVWSPEDVAADLRIDSACWQEYRATLAVPRDDRNAVFFCWLEAPGLVALDQVHLRPAGAGTVREDVLTALGEFGIPLLRFPGGCITTAYHWRFGTGPHPERPVCADPVFKQDITYEFGTNEYLAFCLRYGITPVLTVNLGTGTPDEAAGWAAYCADWYRARGVPPPLLYWQLGNEQYGWWERSHMSGEMYAETVRQLIPGLRRAYPNSRVAALGMEHGDQAGEGRRPWRKPLLDRLGADLDVLSLQLYAIGAPQADATAQHLHVLQCAERHAATLHAAAADCAARGLTARVALSEWNLWLHASHYAPEGFIEPMDVQHGLYAATMFHHFARLAPAMEFAALYQILGGMGTFVVDGPEVRATHLAEVFRLYRPAFPGAVVPLEVHGPALAEGIPTVETLALAGSRGLHLFLVNRSLDESVQVAVQGLPEPATGVTLAGSAPEAAAAERRPAAVARNAVELPPLSVTRLDGPTP